MTVRTAELVMAIVTILVSASIMWKSTELSIGWVPDRGPGSGVWPFYLSAGMLVASITTLVRWFMKATPESRSSETYISRTALYVVGSGRFTVTRAGSVLATIDEPGAVVGEISALLDTTPTATVTATEPSTVKVVEDPLSILTSDNGALLEIARILAGRLSRMSGYLADVKAQYAGAGGHLGLLDEVLAELTYGEQPPAEPGSARDPDPLY